MILTERTICELYARVRNLGQSPGTDRQRITRISTDFVWTDRTWPYPESVKHKLAELILQGVPIAASWKQEERKKLDWPDDGRNLDNEKTRDNEAHLRETRQAMAKALDADPNGAPIPPLGLE